ncbi:MAG TPA: tetratricopeptide repeat protein [Candidatus Sulfotelmatobacter sp.]|nr:tetratricopeptide repeat protein [Candidatus Sulfotelmatobacter sp.]
MREPQGFSAVHSFFQRLLLVVVCLLACTLASAQQQTTTATLVGQLRVTREGSPPMRVLVRLERSGAQVGESYSDPEGKFSFDDLPGNLYHVVIRQEGYRFVELPVDINPSTQHLVYVHIELVPDEKSEAAQATLKGSNSAMVDESSLIDKFPKDAKKQYEKGTKAQREGKSQQAIEHYEKALQIAPAMYFARNNLASLYLENQRFSEAEMELKRVIEENQADANAYFNLANVYLLTNRLNEASDSIQEGLKRQPRSAFGEFLMGSTLMKKGNTREAEKLFHVALADNPGLANARLALVNLYIRQERNPEAVEELSLFLKQSPGSPFAPHARELLNKLQSKGSQ